ncbi:MAG: hypothetical protein AB7N76_17905 [Planctomycetota bacterium]
MASVSHALLLVLLAALSAAGLAWLARAATGRWAVATGLLLGSDEAGVEADLRFWALSSGLSLSVAGALLLPPLQALDAPRQVLALALGVPAAALLVSALAEGISRLPAWQRRVARAQQTAALSAALERARDQVERARQHALGARREATESLAEALEGYAEALGRGELEGLAERIACVLDMARSCLLEEGREAARVLGLRPDASPAEARAVFQAVARVYAGPEALPGASPEKHDELLAAFERLELRHALTASEAAERLAA